MSWQHTINAITYRFADLRTLLAKASPARSGDDLAGLSASSAAERMAARLSLAEVPLATIVANPVIPYEMDEVTRLICDRHPADRFAPVSGLSVGEFRNWLLHESTDATQLAFIAPAITPEVAAAVSKLMRNQDLILVARKCRVVTRFRNTIGLP
ncbi:ethanolamine ammonia-lyase subunit EutB, partial [Gemmatimonas sp.]|uniref:ethanolamine ammonia-lyase subunit EutB n=1 Tax=Gemmatimonas sp. TaxID=1962908 RepID=UPI0037C0590A